MTHTKFDIIPEEPYHNTAFGFTDYNHPLGNYTIYYIYWTNEHGNEQKTRVNNEVADKWEGYALLYEFCSEEILILK